MEYNYMEYSWTSLCRCGRDPEKYFDKGMFRDNQLGIMGSETCGQDISFKKNTYLPLRISFIGEYKIKR